MESITLNYPAWLAARTLSRSPFQYYFPTQVSFRSPICCVGFITRKSLSRFARGRRISGGRLAASLLPILHPLSKQAVARFVGEKVAR